MTPKDPIYKTPFGKHIDLSKLVSVGDVLTCGNFEDSAVSFEMVFQLMDKPEVIRRKLKLGEEFKAVNEDEPAHCRNYHYLTTKGEWRDPWNIEDFNDLQAVANMQSQIDEIIQAWREYKSSVREDVKEESVEIGEASIKPSGQKISNLKVSSDGGCSSRSFGVATSVNISFESDVNRVEQGVFHVCIDGGVTIRNCQQTSKNGLRRKTAVGTMLWREWDAIFIKSRSRDVDG